TTPPRGWRGSSQRARSGRRPRPTVARCSDRAASARTLGTASRPQAGYRRPRQCRRQEGRHAWSVPLLVGEQRLLHYQLGPQRPEEEDRGNDTQDEEEWQAGQHTARLAAPETLY